MPMAWVPSPRWGRRPMSAVAASDVSSAAATRWAQLGLGRAPEPSEVPSTAGYPSSTGRDVRPKEMLRTLVFWLMFALMPMMSTDGSMVTSNFANFARDFGVVGAVLGMAALPLALTFDRLMNGFTRPFFGWVSDRIGRENTMGLALLSTAARSRS